MNGPANETADVSVATQRERVLGWCRRHAPGEAVTLRETHVSILAFTADRVWKCKKPVRFPFIDLSTAAQRESNCEREIALNRRLAPDVYLGVVPLDDDRGVVVDHLVEMRQLPEDRRLSSIVTRESDVGTLCVDEVVDLLVRFHEQAPTGDAIDRAATTTALTELWTGSLDELKPFVGRVLDADTYERVGNDARGYLAGRSALIEDRIAGRKIRDGHGDLLADDVFCLPDGPRVLDCLEFDDRLRFGDVLGDLAFLAMDLERLGRRDLSHRLFDRYRVATGDRWPESLEHLYVAYRALVRTKVACLRVADDEDAGASAQTLLDLAARHLDAGRVRLVLIGGPPATGKTTLAESVAHVTGWPVFHSDEVRKELAGLEPTASAAARVDGGLYSASWSDRTYGALLARAREQLTRGQSVILDASWSTEARREAAEQLAVATTSELRSFACEVDPATADTRAAARARRGLDASDASPAIASELRARFAPWPAAFRLDTSAALDLVAARMLTQLGPAISRE